MLAVTSSSPAANRAPHYAAPTNRYIDYATRTETDNGASLKKAMYSELLRLKSFDGWPNNHVKPEHLARAGFFYTKVEDRVRCPFCQLEVESWEEGDDASSDHQRWSEHCPFILGSNCGNVPLGTDLPQMSSEGYDTCGRYGIEVRPNSFPERENVTKYAVPRVKGPSYPDYSSSEKRLESFKEWPISIKQRPKELGEAGFFYTGKGDKTLCFHCGGGLKNWEESDDPWEQHAKWFSACEFLTLQKGPKYISDICKNSTPIITSKEASLITQSRVPLEKDCASTSASISASVSEVQTAASQEEPKDGSSSTLCKICYNKEIGVAFLPCGHVVACVDCAPALTKCAVCCGEIAASCRVFLS